jgi:hypothetical protein
VDNPEETSRNPGEATEAAARKILVLLELLRSKAIRFSTYEHVYGRDYRSFQRDLQHLRKIGEEAGFKISPIANRERAELSLVDSQLRSLDASPRVVALISALSGALGAPVARELGRLGQSADETGFLRLLLPQLVEQTQIGETYDRLKAAWEARPGPALVTFQYDPGNGKKTTRRVDPYRLLLRSGSAYLVGYDVDKRAWRMFALDRFRSLPERAGTVQRLRQVPPQYDSSDTVGFFKTAGDAVAVTVELTPAVAASATSRRWQAAQRVEHLPGGFARITFEVTEIGEVVRWALGFGKEARIVAPPEAVEIAIRTVDEIAAAYRA